MFTGIIEHTGTVKSVEKKGTSGRITVEAALSLDSVCLGGSIAVDGVCLTVTGIKKGSFSADLSAETITLTTLGSLKGGEKVNLELPLTLSKPLGGHLVTGHIDGVGVIKRMAGTGGAGGGEGGGGGAGFVDIEFSVPATLMAQIARKGSVAVDGISLTVAGTLPDGFRAAVIPHTLKLTTLSGKREGSKVNIETDLIAKYVERFFLRQKGGESPAEKGGVTEGLLSEHGFLRKD